MMALLLLSDSDEDDDDHLEEKSPSQSQSQLQAQPRSVEQLATNTSLQFALNDHEGKENEKRKETEG